jgi:pyruvate/2-oxoglutarate dehydrogenase complex dihydrolipoamide acyltransferase (E2) component
MKKLAIVLIGIIFALSLTGIGLAQQKAEPGKPAEAAKPSEPAKPAEPAKPEAVKKEAPPKPVVYRMGGSVVSIDAAAKKITIKQDSVKKQKKVMLSVGKKAAKDLAGINVGDVVNIWVTGKTITSITKIF